MSEEERRMADLDSIPWPRHAASLHVNHNQHKAYYETVEEALIQGTYSAEDFPDEAEIAKAIAADSVWEVQWYPDTPVGFCRVAAATLGRALEVANQ